MLHDNAISFRHLNSTDHIVLYLQNGDCIVTSLDPMYTALGWADVVSYTLRSLFILMTGLGKSGLLSVATDCISTKLYRK